MLTIKRVLVVPVLAGIGLCLLVSATTAQPSPLTDVITPADWTADRPLYRPNQLAVQFAVDTSRERAFNVVGAMGSKFVYSARHVPGLHVVTLPAGKTLQQAIEAYQQRPDVAYAEPNYVDYPFDVPYFVPNDPLFDKQWHLDLIGCKKAWNVSRGIPGVIVAIVDSGVAFKAVSGHPRAPDLAGTKFTKPYDAVDGDNEPVDDVNHGTHVCGTIAQTTNNAEGVAGVAHRCTIMPVRSLGPGGGDHAQMKEAFYYAADNGARVINYSAGGTHSTTKQQGVQYAYNKGVLIIAAMGNAGEQDSANAYPARYSQVVGVAACRLNKAKADYSNWGDGVEITGPGGDLADDLDGNGSPDGVLQNTFASGLPDSGFKYYYMVGTSMATPHVTGVAALIYSKLISDGQSPTRDQVRTILRQTAEDIGPSGFDTTFGHGLVRADRALSSPGGSPPTLSWLDVPGYMGDGVKPNKAPADTIFKFRVKYTDVDGDAPVTAQLEVQWLRCDRTWRTLRTKTLIPKTGSIKTGKNYYAAVRLPNCVYRYRFVMADGDGAATGPPANWQQGPMTQAGPLLCWVGGAKYASDGVDPDGGPPGTGFTFKVRYMDSLGNAPRKRNVVLRRNGSFYRRLAMNARTGTIRTGRLFARSTKLTQPGTYEYRFEFTDPDGTASGAPTKWKSMDQVQAAGGATVQVTGVTAAQTRQGGGEIIFTLSAEAAVTAQVLNIAGRPVRMIAQGRDMPAGVNSLLWDGRSDTGSPVPAGMYIVRICAASGSGGQANGMAVMSVRR